MFLVLIQPLGGTKFQRSTSKVWNVRKRDTRTGRVSGLFPEKSKAKTSTCCPVLRRFKKPSLMQADITWRADDAEDSFLRDLFLKGWNKRTGQIVLRAMKKQPFHPNKIRVMPVLCRILTLTWRPIPCRDWGSWPGAWTAGHSRECRISRFTAIFEPKLQINTRYHQIFRFDGSDLRFDQARLIRQVRTEGTAPQAGPLDSNDRRVPRWQKHRGEANTTADLDIFFWNVLEWSM